LDVIWLNTGNIFIVTGSLFVCLCRMNTIGFDSSVYPQIDCPWKEEIKRIKIDEISYRLSILELIRDGEQSVPSLIVDCYEMCGVVLRTLGYRKFFARNEQAGFSWGCGWMRTMRGLRGGVTEIYPLCQWCAPQCRGLGCSANQ
jgi:hypothetical protein